ncbi:MAG: serine/threonine protein kinase [Anaerolineae bacterium]
MTEQPQHIRQQFGPYITLKLIGSGEQSAVFGAIHETSGKMVALRLLTIPRRHVQLVLDTCESVLRDLAETTIPHAVRLHDFGHQDNTLYLATTLLYGGTLLDRMNARSFGQDDTILPSIADVLDLTARMAITLDTLHQREMVHGQLRPNSIIFDAQGNAHLTEIGLTRILKIIYQLDTTNSFNMTRYSPPELWNGERPSPATDQYALACIVYQLLTGQVPFDGKSILTLMQAHADDVALPPHYIKPELPENLALIFWQALAKPVENRYPTVNAFYQDLQHCLNKTTQTSKTDFFTFPIH